MKKFNTQLLKEDHHNHEYIVQKLKLWQQDLQIVITHASFCYAYYCIFVLIISLSCAYLCYDYRYSQNQLVAIQLWVDAFRIAMILFQLLSIEFCHRYTSMSFIRPKPKQHKPVSNYSKTRTKVIA